MKSKYIILAISAVAIISFTIMGILKTNVEKENIRLKNRIATLSPLKQLSEDMAVDVAYISNTITSQNKELKKELKSMNRKINYQANITAELMKIIVKEPAVEEVTDTGFRYPLYYMGEGVTVEGEFLLPQQLFDISIKHSPIELVLTVTEDKDGIWETFINTTNPYIKFSKIDSKVNPFNKQGGKNFWVIGSIYGGKTTYADYRFGGALTLGFKSLGVYSGFDRFGMVVGVSKLWRF